MNDKVKEMLNKVEDIKEMFQTVGFIKGLEFADQMNHMLVTYAGTKHEAEVIADVQNSINKIVG